MQGKKILITGATSGIGKETALGLARMGAEIIITTRNIAKGEEVRDFIVNQTGNKAIFPMFCELSSFRSVKDFCTEFLARNDSLHVLINNAGIMESKRKESYDGIELTFAVNHLAPFLLTRLLLGTLKKNAPARIINVSSGAHANADVDFDDIEMKKNFNGFKAYSRSKLYNIFFTYKLAEELQGTGVTVNCLHPGFVNTPIFKNIPSLVRFFFPLLTISPAKGAETSIYLASSPEVEKVTGKYFVRKKITRSSELSYDKTAADRLWEISNKYVHPYLI